jgi:hypothetical protein
VARYGPSDDFNNQPTRHASYGAGGHPTPGGAPPTIPAPDPQDGLEQPEPVDPFDQETEPKPWYRKPAALLAWALAVTVLIALIVYGISELIGEGRTPSNVPSSTTTTPSTTTPTTTQTTTETTPTTEPSTSSASEPPPQQPTQQPPRQQTQQPSHRHHLPPLPSVITIPEVPTVITLPPGLH